MIYEAERNEICEYSKRMWRDKLVVGTAGNISMRAPDDGRFIITPSSVSYDELTPEEVLIVDDEGDPIDDEEFGRAPSFETPMHLGIYAARKNLKAIVHTHSRYATVMATLRRPIPPAVDEMIVYLGGQIEVAKHAVSGSDELADNVVNALGGRAAVLLAAHGALAAGKDLKTAYRNAELLEHVASVVVMANQLAAPTGHSVEPLSPEIVEAEKQMYKVLTGA